MSRPEFSRPVRLDTLGAVRRIDLVADAAEREALAERFGLLALGRLDAALNVERDGERVRVAGRIGAELAQPCVATGAAVPVMLDEPLALDFLPAVRFGDTGEEEIELAEADLDTLPHDGLTVDLGEAVAQTLGLALDPYPRSPEASEALRAAGVIDEEAAGPFGALAALKETLGRK